MWTQQEAIALCVAVEAVCPQFGCHVALTGGALYKEGPRKDADLLFYRIRQVERIDWTGLSNALKKLGFELGQVHGWVRKAKYNSKNVDMFDPEHINAAGSGNGNY